MDAFKGVFRRANQAMKEKSGRSEATHDDALENATKRVRVMEKHSCGIMDKVAKLNNAFEEIGTLCSGIAEDYKATALEGSTAPEMVQLAMELGAFGQEVTGKAQELQRNLRENAYENLGTFVRDVPQLKTTEEDKKKKQLEYDFFRTKVANLIKDPPKDSTRIPRNENIRENWRTQLWQTTEQMKAQVSTLTLTGQKGLDSAVYTVALTMGNFSGYVVNSAKNHFTNATLPAYNPAPLLPPMAMPPPPPPYVPPQAASYGGAYGAPPQPGQPGYGQPGYAQQPQPGQPGYAPQQQQQQAGGYASQPSGAYQSPPAQNTGSPNPQGYNNGAPQQQYQQQPPPQQGGWENGQQQQQQQQADVQPWNSHQQQAQSGDYNQQQQQQQQQQPQAWNNNQQQQQQQPQGNWGAQGGSQEGGHWQQ